MRQPSSMMELAFHALPEIYVVLDRSLIVRAFNSAASDAAVRTYGRDVKIGVSARDYLPESEFVHFERHIRRALSGETVQSHRRVRAVNGRAISYDVTYVAIRDSAGIITGAALHARDVTNARLLQQQVRDSYVRYLRLYDDADVGLFTFDIPDGSVSDCNPHFFKLLGYRSREELRRSFSLRTAMASAEDYDQLVNRVKNETHCTLTLGLRDCSGRTVKLSGTLRLTENGAQIDGTLDAAPGAPAVPFAVTSRDQCLECVIEDTEAIFLRLDSDGTIVYINQYSRKFFGYEDEELIGRSIFDTITPETQSGGKNLRDTFRDALMNPENYRRSESQNVLRTGERIWMSWSATPIYDSDGMVRELLLIGHDVTARRQIEDQLAQSEAHSRAILGTLPDLMFRFDRQGTYLECHAPDFDMLLGAPAELIGRKLSEVGLPLDVVDVSMRAIDEALQTGEIQEFEFEMDVPKGLYQFECRMIKYAPDEVLSLVRDIRSRKSAEREREKLIAELQAAVERVHALHGLLPICTACKKIRDDDGYWGQLDEYLSAHSDVEFTDGLCPDCISQLYPEYDKRIRDGEGEEKKTD